MLREITLAEAIQRMGQGERIPCLRPLAPNADWKDMATVTLNGLLAGVVCFADEPDKLPEAEEPPKQKKPRKPRVAIDRQKVIGLYASGWKINHIAEEVGCHPNTVKIIIEEEKSRLDAEEAMK